MTFDEAVEVVTEYGAGYGIKRGLLLDSLTLIRDDLAYCENDEDAPMMVTQREIAAYRIVCREMRKLFV
jgi:hypothetical protein